ncbi:MAG: IMP dehydrogenase [Spirochaetaceae bacterium]
MLEIQEKLSYDDVLLVPDYADFFYANACVKTRIAKDIYLNSPIMSAAMDTVTEEKMAIALALQGGVGVIHRNLSYEEQAKQVSKVKRYLNWVIDSPITVGKDQTIADVRMIMDKYQVSGLPVVENGKLAGIITGRDLRFCTDFTQKVESVMTKDPVVEKGVPTVETAKEKFNTHRIEKVPIINDDGELTGLITVKDLEKHEQYPNAAMDKRGRLLCGAAISPQDYHKRIPLLKESGVDFIVLDVASGDTKSVIDCIKDIKATYDIVVIGGNAATKEAAQRLIDAGSDAIKVGIGPGSICTTRIVAGIGVPQLSAVADVCEVAEKYDIPVIADGGIKFSGDISKAIGAGANAVMVGNLFAGLKEAPGREIIFEGRIFKTYRGMGSVGAIVDGSGDRYQMKEGDSPVPEGIEGRVPYKGELKAYLEQLVTGLKKGMGYTGCKTIDELRKYKKFVKISSAGLRESHAHDISITQEAPNYSRS